MITETLYAGRDNVFSLQLVRGEGFVNLQVISVFELNLSNGRVFTDTDLFKIKEDGILEVSIGHLFAPDELGTFVAYLVTYDHINVNGVRWPNFKIKVKA